MIFKYDLSSLEHCSTAGEPLSEEVFNTFKKLTGMRLMEGFGQTETTLSLANYSWMNPKPGSMGKPSPGYKVELLRADDSLCEDGETGQIVFKLEDKNLQVFLHLITVMRKKPAVFLKTVITEPVIWHGEMRTAFTGL